ncbi:CGGC domain-containing protein [Clostridiaceae bacterium 35-E11]
MTSKYVVIIQCDIAHNRCSGFACTNDFYNRTGKFTSYPQDIKYISFTCGGCCGKSVSAKMEHISKSLKKHTEVSKDEVVIHLASCMTTDNHHYDRCPHVEYIKQIIDKKGFHHIVEGSFVSKTATKLREKGVYKCY